jgi:hypothetical protein
VVVVNVVVGLLVGELVPEVVGVLVSVVVVRVVEGDVVGVDVAVVVGELVAVVVAVVISQPRNTPETYSAMALFNAAAVSSQSVLSNSNPAKQKMSSSFPSTGPVTSVTIVFNSVAVAAHVSDAIALSVSSSSHKTISSVAEQPCITLFNQFTFGWHPLPPR